MNIPGFDAADLQLAISKLNTLPKGEQIEFLAMLETYEKEALQQKRQDDFLAFIDHVYTGYKVGPHHRQLAKIFEEIANGVK